MDNMSKKILIIDDEPMLLSALVDKFTREGFSVTTAENGDKGLKMALKSHPDLILLDIIMPVMDGMTMFFRLREDEWGKRAKVILLTNLSDPGKVASSAVQKANAYLIKSDWKIADVVKEVKKKLAE